MKNLGKCSIIEAVDLEDSNINETGRIIKNSIKEKRVFLIGTDVNAKLNKVIEKIYKKTKVNLTSVRFAYDIDFKYRVTLCYKYLNKTDFWVHNRKTFSELLKFLSFDENDFLDKYLVIIDDTNEKNKDNLRDEIIKIYQQFVFLDFDVEILAKSEFDNRNKRDKFYNEDYYNIIKSVDLLYSQIEKILNDNNVSGKYRKLLKNKKKFLDTIQSELYKSKSNLVRIAIMGTKKAGKSVIVNSLLNCDYAPSNLELPTPNNIFYIPNIFDDKLYLEYNGEKRHFDTSEDLKKYITDEFEKAQDKTGKGSELEDMTIYYPSDEDNKFEIIDTPGPNFAGAGDEHKKKTEEARKIADVCIFLVNYSNHLTNNEIDYLKEIHKDFKNLNSLVISINRIDDRYKEDEKSVVRIVDYIQDRLEKLDYKNLLIFNTSALQSFYLEKVRKLWEEYIRWSVSFADITPEIIDELKNECSEEEEDEKTTALNFIGNSFVQMKDFNKIKNPNGEQLYLLSGIPKLKKYCRYIAEQRINRNIIDLTSKLDEIKKIENLILEYEKTKHKKINIDTKNVNLTSKFDDIKQIENKVIKYERTEMKTSLNKCSIIEPVDLNESNVNETGKNIKANIKTKKIFLLGTDVNLKLDKVIDKISKESKVNLTSGRFAYELNFKYPTVLRKESGEKKETEVKKFSELLENLDYDENGYIKGKFLAVIDDKQEKDKENIQREISTLFQQIVFLNLDLDICTKTELEIKYKKNIFRKNYETILDTVKKSFDEIEKIEKNKKIDGKDLTDESFEKVQKIKNSLSIIKKGIEDAKARPIRIAVMGTKKAGKSVIINSLLNCDYAPTSLELPTPNNIIYTPNNKDNILCLEYKREKKTFDTADKLKQYITNEFEIAQDKTGKGSELKDMRIYYPSDTLTGFEILDTPGPNFAGAGEEHAKKTEKAIKIADVCIFVINYSTHLTNDEASYLEKIRNYFKEHDKFYSLFITVNRIDERYSTDVEKSVIRIIDYIRNRLEELQYNNISVFGTSALQSFYLEKVRQIQKEYSQNEQVLLGNINAEIIDELKDKYEDDDEKLTPLNFIGKSFIEMKDFHKMKNGNGEQLNLLSGMPQLDRYCHYIGEQKADTEIVNAVLFKVDMNLADIRNKFFLKELKELVESLGQEIEDLKKDVKDLQKTAKIIFDRLNVDEYKEQINRTTSKIVKDYIDEVYVDFEGDLIDIICTINFDKDAVYKLMQNEYKISTNIKDEIDKSFDFYNTKIIEILNKRLDINKKGFATELESKFKDCSVEIQNKYDSIKSKIEKNITLRTIVDKVSMPNVSFSFQKRNDSSLLVDSFDYEINSFIQDSIKKNTKIQNREYTRNLFEAWSEGDNILESSWNVFVTLRNKGRELVGSNKVYRDNADLDKVKEEYVKYMKDSLKKEFYKGIESLKDKFDELQKTIFKDLSTQCDEVKDFYNNTFTDFYNALDKLSKSKSEDKEKNEKQIKELEYIESKLKDVYKSFEFLEERN